MPTRIRNAVIAPLLIIAAVAMLAILLVGTSAYMAAQKEARLLEHAAKTALTAKETAENLLEAETYVRSVMAMTRVIPETEVRAEFETRLAAITRNIETLKQSKDQDYLDHVDHMIEAFELWTGEAELVLGLKPTTHLPTLETLDKSVGMVRKHAEHVVEFSHNASAQAIEAANTSIANSIRLGSLLTAGMFVVALTFAWRMSDRISQAMQSVSASLRLLSDRENSTRATSPSEIETMFSSLKILEKSVAEKAIMADQLREEKHRAEEAVQTKSRFLANMSHEIRTPINGVLGMAEILHGTDLSFEQRECAQTILKSSEALLSVINDILDFSKNEAGEVQLEDCPFSLSEIIFDVAGLLGPAIGGTDVEISIDYAEDLPHWFRGDPGRIRQVLMNLLGNAIKFTPKGHVIVAVTYQPDHELPLSIAIKDDGIGIAEDKVAHIFDAFQQAEMHASRRFQGTGLGLAITRHLVQLMQGYIQVTSQLGIGSTFTIRLQLDQAEAAKDDTQINPINLNYLAGKHVLVVDDIALNRAILRKSLGGWGMIVHCFDRPEAVLAADLAELEKIDIGLLDYNMPYMCGDELFAMLRSRLGESCFPAILYSSSDQSAELKSLTDRGFASILMKPTRSTVMAQSFLNVLGPGVRPAQSLSSEDLPDIADLRILIAEDNKTNRLVLDKMLAPTGADYQFCENGLEAVNLFKSESFDLILMDMAMPVMDGITASGEIRSFEAKEGRALCPIIALTANAMESDRDACAAAGMTDFLTKPVRKSELLNHISKANVRPKGPAYPKKGSAIIT